MSRRDHVVGDWFLYTDDEGVLYLRHSPCGKVARRFDVAPPTGMVDYQTIVQSVERHSCPPPKQ